MRRKLIVIPVILILAFFLFIQNCSPAHQSKAGKPGEYPTQYPDRIVATWNQDPSSSFNVTWRTDSSITEGQAMIALAKDAPKFHLNAQSVEAKVQNLKADRVGEDVKANYHTATFKNLAPNTLYAYKVGANGKWSEWFQIKTACKQEKPFQFIYLGDAQTDILSHWSRDIRAAFGKASDAAFIIHAGDLVNHAHRNEEWGEWNLAGSFIQSMIPNIAVPGNHEYWRYTDNRDDPRLLSIHWRKQFEFPINGPEGLEETAYYIDYQGMRIIALNSNRKIDEQSKWLEKILKDNPNRWTVTTHHHPIYSSGEGRNNEELRAAWEPIYSKYGVDLVMQGHDHTYARGRTKNIKKGVNVRDRETGTVYVNSVSGSKMYNMRDTKWDPMNGVMKRAAENTQLYQTVSVTHDTLKFRAYTASGELYDSFDIVQQDGQLTNKIIEHPVEVEERTFENTMKY